MKKFILKILAISLVFVGFVACSDDDDDDDIILDVLEDIDIVIDQDQTFNMTNFAISFEQMFASYERWEWDYSHDIQSGKAVETYQNRKIYGSFGDKVYTITHSFNMDGVITSSSRIRTARPDSAVDFTYIYDTEGMIVELTKRRDGSIVDVVELEYNANKQLVKKTHRGDYNYSDGTEENFTYNSEGQVITYIHDSWGDSYAFIYADGNMIREEQTYSGTTYEHHYEYDSQGRLINRYYDDDIYDNRAFEYYDDYYREIDYDEYNGSRRYDDIQDHSSYDVDIKRWDFDYDGADFEFCTTKEYFYEVGHDRRLVSKKEYFEGTPENLVAVGGYVIVDTRDPANDYRKTKESIYDWNDTLLYYVEYEVSGNSIQSHQLYFPDGTMADDSEITGDLSWIARLISHLD